MQSKVRQLMFILLAMVLPASVTVAADLSGLALLKGVVTDSSGDALPGITVTASSRQGEPSVAYTEMDGSFSLGGLTPGAYEVQASLDGFQPVSEEVRLRPDEQLSLRFALVPAFGETVEVSAEAERTGEVSVMESRRESAVVSDRISSEEIRKTPDSNAASVVERLAGVSVVDGKYVFVRGLGERYSNATVNGSTVPTTETEKRVVPLDLFPAKLLDQVNIVKTFTPDRPGDFGSGVVEMVTTEFPDGASFKVSLGSAYRGGTTGEAFRGYAGGLGTLGGGGQAMPTGLPGQALSRRSILNPEGFSPAELEVIGEKFIGDWTGTRHDSISPGTDFTLTYGNTFGPLGVVLSAVSNHGYETIEEAQRFFGLDTGNVLVPRNDYEMVTDTESVTSGVVGNLALRIADGHKISLQTLATRNASAENRFQEGLNTNTGGLIRDYRVRYKNEEVLSGKLSGEHEVWGPDLGGLLQWDYSYSEASNASDLRENLYRESEQGVYALQVGFPESGKMDYFDLQDEIDQAGGSYSMFFAPSGGWFGSMKTGVSRSHRTRDFGARRFRFVTPNQLQFDLTGTPESIFTPENIRPGGFEIREVTGVNDGYDAEHTVEALYLMGDATFGSWRLIGGARYEDSIQSVTTFNPFDLANEVESLNVEQDLLPSVNVVYQYAPRSNLRFAYGRSVNRPEFRELSPFTFVEVTGGRSVAGNPELQQATIDAYDVRWEIFPREGEVLAASVFYKKIDSPIERIVQPTTELRTSFVNAEAATLWGIELEGRKALGDFHPALRLWSINGNYTMIESDVVVGEQQLSVITNQNRPLEGQSDQTANLALQFLHPGSGTMVRLLGSYTGDRLTDVGAFGLPDIYEEAYMPVDLVVTQDLGRFTNGIELKIAASNLFDEIREYTQGSMQQRAWEPGRTLSLSLSYSPF